MTRKIDPLHKVLVSDALSFFVGKTVQRIAQESGVEVSIVKRIIRDTDGLERKGNLFRIENQAPWRRG